MIFQDQKKILYRHAVLLILFLLAWTSALPFNGLQVNYYSPENILRFAESLFKEGDYFRAAGEYQRYLYSFDSLPPDADSIFFKIGLCYRFGKDFSRSINYFQKIIDKYPESASLDDSYYQIGYSYFLMKNFEESISFLDSSFSLIKSDSAKRRIHQLIGLNHIYQKQWDRASLFLNSLEEKTKNHMISQKLSNLAEEGKRLPRKSKFLAGFMSALVPGTGKMYCHRISEGIFSFVTIGLTTWQAYNGFHKNGAGSVNGWVYGTLSVFFYLGNIYGSVVSVNIYNHQLEDKFFEKVNVTINVYFQ